MPRGKALVVASAALAVATACAADTVQVEPPHADTAATALCRKLYDALPAKLHGDDRRTTTPESRLTAVWGDPAIALRCGVPRPAALRPTSNLAEIDGLSWLPQPEGVPTQFTLLGRGAYVEMIVPRTVKLPGEVLSELAPRLKAALPARKDGTL
jgi:hypothetical protein